MELSYKYQQVKRGMWLFGISLTIYWRHQDMTRHKIVFQATGKQPPACFSLAFLR